MKRSLMNRCFIAVTILMVAVVLQLALVAPATAKVRELMMGSTSSRSSMYPFMVAFAGFVNKYVPDVHVTVVESTSTLENIDRLRSKDFDFEVSGSLSAGYQVYHGIQRYEGKAFPEIRRLYIYQVAATMYGVRQDSGVKTIGDLHGKRFSAGIPGSQTEANVRGALGVLGIEPKWYAASLADATAALKDGRIVGFAKGSAKGNIASNFIEVNTVRPVNFLSFTEEQKAKVVPKMPWLPWVHQPAGSVKGFKPLGDILVHGFIAGSLTTKDLPEDIAYGITKALHQHGEELQATGKMLPGWKFVESTIEYQKTAPTPLHAGFVRYCTEIGLQVPKELIPPEYSK